MMNTMQKLERCRELDRQISATTDEMRDLHRRAGGEDLSGGAAERWHNLKRAVEKREAERDTLTAEVRTEMAEGVAYGTMRTVPADGPTDRHGWYADDGRRVIDDAFRSGTLPDHAAERATA